jgi:hypothetical protein
MSYNLVFKYEGTGDRIFDPMTLEDASPITVRVENAGETDLTGLGVFFVPATNLGPVDYPSDFPPDTDYQDIISVGDEIAEEGLKVTIPQEAGTNTYYINREQGSTLRNKLPVVDIPASSYIDIVIEYEDAVALGARRLFVDMRVE